MNSIRLLGLLTALLFCAQATAAPVFKVTKDKHTVYIGGTFHLLTENDFPLQDAFYQAYKQSDEVYFETDIDAVSKPAFMASMMKIMQFQDGQNIKSVLDDKTFARLEAYFVSRGLPVQQFLPLTPTGLTLTITIMEYQARGFSLAGVDEHFFEKAKSDTKTIKWFEDIQQQIAFLGSMNDEDPNHTLNYMLDSMSELDAMVNDLHSAWREGDMVKLEKVGLSAFDEYPDMYDIFIKDRNNAWMKVIEPMFADTDTELVLVGALHLPGKDGLLTQLAAQGYTVERVSQ